MDIFDEIDKLLSERSTTAELKKRVLLLKEQFAALGAQVSIYRNQTKALMEEIANLKMENKNIKFENSKLCEKMEKFHNSNHRVYTCEHCGSTKMKMIGKPHNRIFEDLGVKDAIFICEECGKESAFIISLPG